MLQTLLYGTARGRHNPGEYQHIDVRGRPPATTPACRIDRGARREHVVDQHQPPTSNLDPVFGWDNKRPLNVVGSLRSRSSDLLRRGADAFESLCAIATP
ncbi:MAG: hypothetical protein WB752_07265, partial [Pseudolabrys sp.]